MAEISRGLTMHKCVSCESEHVFPHSWEEHGPDHWLVLLYCGNCEVYREDIFHQWECELFDEWIDDCQDEIASLANELEDEIMQQWVDKTIQMINMDIVMPEDFNIYPRD